MLKYKLRRGRPNDARVTKKILLSALTEHGFALIDASPDAEVATFGATDPRRDDFVAVFAGKVVGFAILIAAGRGAGELSKVFVTRSHRGRGVGTMLIAKATATAKARGYTSLHLSTNPAFAGACAYYDHHGWKQEPTGDPEALFYRLPLQEAPQVLPVLPPLLRGVLSLLDKLTQRRERLQHDLAQSRDSHQA